MNIAQIRTLAQVRQFLDGTLGVEMQPLGDEAARHRVVSEVLGRFSYRGLKRADRGLVLCFLRAVSGFSRAQLTRMVARWLRGRPLVKERRKPVHAFTRRYSDTDIARLAEIDRGFDTLSGPATVRLLQRAWSVYGDARFERLADLSVSHLYNLRGSRRYRDLRVVHRPTRATATPIGVRKAPTPRGRPGFIRVDTVHQGDQDGIKGVYYINAVDCITQWQVAGCVEKISEAYLLPVLRQMLAQFPFRVRGFHSDNGSEFINAKVAALLEKLRIELTKSRPRHSNDNALAETKNGAVVRKMFGYGHISQRHAAPINAFCRTHLNPFLNLHRPCLFATDVADPKKPGRVHKIYRHTDVKTPLEKLLSLPRAASYLRSGVSLAELQQQAIAQTDLQAAEALNRARQNLFATIRRAA